MADEKELARLEGFVVSLLEKFKALQDENGELNDRLQKREATIETLEEELAGMKDERGVISNRVGSLIDKIEEWESTSGVEGAKKDSADDVADEAASDPGAQQGNLFSVDAKEGAGSE